MDSTNRQKTDAEPELTDHSDPEEEQVQITYQTPSKLATKIDTFAEEHNIDRDAAITVLVRNGLMHCTESDDG